VQSIFFVGIRNFIDVTKAAVSTNTGEWVFFYKDSERVFFTKFLSIKR